MYMGQQVEEQRKAKRSNRCLLQQVLQTAIEPGRPVVRCMAVDGNGDAAEAVEMDSSRRAGQRQGFFSQHSCLDSRECEPGVTRRPETETKMRTWKPLRTQKRRSPETNLLGLAEVMQHGGGGQQQRVRVLRPLVGYMVERRDAALVLPCSAGPQDELGPILQYFKQ